TPGGVGYVELTYAKENNLPVALVRNRGGNWVEPSAEGTTAAITAFSEELAKDVRVPIVDPPESAKDAYPIAGLTYLFIPKQGQDAKKTQTLKDFVQFIVTQVKATRKNSPMQSCPIACNSRIKTCCRRLELGAGNRRKHD